MDRISELSDEILIKILLLVPTKVAASTSILSKRWEYLWIWLPKLEYGLRCPSSSECKLFQCFLDKNLPLHRAPVLESFSLDIYISQLTPENVMMWVVIAVSHCVRELGINYFCHPKKSNILPSNLYTCKSLVILKLTGNILLDVPRMVFLPSLKTLHLLSVRYFSDVSLPRFLSNCPLLEDLSVELLVGDRMEKLTVVVPSLQSLSLFIPYCYKIDGIVIKTPSLKYFKLNDQNDESHYYLIENMPNLIEAAVDVAILNIKSLFGSITSVKRLTICSKAYHEGFVFNHLQQLKLCRCRASSLNRLLRLLKDSSNLQVLEICITDDHDISDYYSWKQPSTVPKCILQSLQTLIWSDYSGTPQERDLVVYILKNAAHLKTTTITSFEEDGVKFKMIKELALSSRASTTCQLVFH